jgi:PadR family transcriptional regulator, regulatory protein PadR
MRPDGDAKYFVPRYIGGMAPHDLSEQSFFVLTALTGGPRHGYAVLKDVAELSDARLRMSVGTLYGILDRLAARGAIEMEREEIVDSRMRRYYRLTDDGRRLLAQEAARQAANARVALDRLARLRPGAAGSAG